MKRHYYLNEPVYLCGYVYYDDMTPVINGIVILEEMDTNCNKTASGKYISKIFTLTNRDGQFYFRIYNRNKYYKIKLFKNNRIDETSYRKIYMDN